MKNEKHFSQNIEQAEGAPRTFSIKFDKSHFGDNEINPDIVAKYEKYGTCYGWIPGRIGRWWEKICSENSLEIKKKELEGVLYYLVEVARNALEKVGSGEIKVIFEPNKIIVTISDQGHGFEDPNKNILSNHGLDHVRKYADEFIIETNGAKFTKIPKKKKLARSEDTDVKRGSKITFIKNFE